MSSYLHRLALRGLMFALSLCLGACTRSIDTPEAAAQAFVDRYFIELDQQAALGLTEGLAHAKLEDEIKRLGAEAPSGSDERARIYSKQLSQTVHDDGVAFRFRLTVVVAGDTPVEPEILVRVRSNGGAWRVSNFEMLPMPPRHSGDAPEES